MSAAGVRAGKAFVEIDANVGPLEKGLKGISGQFKNMSMKVGQVGRGIAGVGAAITGLGAAALGPLLAATKGFQEAGDTIHKMGIRTGISAEALSQLAFAAEQSGTDIKGVSDAIFRMNRRIANAATGGGPAKRALEGLGIAAGAFSKLKPEEQFLQVAQALKEMDDQALASQYGFEIMGDNWKQLAPLMKEGGKGIRSLMKEADRLGKTITQDDADAAASLGDAYNRVATSAKAAFFQLGAALAPALEKVFSHISKVVMAVADWAKNNRPLVATIAAIAAGLVSVGTVVVGLGGSVVALGAVLGGLSTAFSVVSAAVAAVGAPVLAVVAGIAALSAGIVALLGYMGALTPIVTNAKILFAQLYKIVGFAVEGIGNAISANNWGLAMQIGLEAMKLAAIRFGQFLLNTFQGMWKAIKTNSYQTLLDIAGMIKKIPGMLWEFVKNPLGAGKQMTAMLAKGLVQGGGQWGDALNPLAQNSGRRFTALTNQARAGAVQQGGGGMQSEQRRQTLLLEKIANKSGLQ